MGMTPEAGLVVHLDLGSDTRVLRCTSQARELPELSVGFKRQSVEEPKGATSGMQ